jgi:hypothetical protein
MRWRPGHLALLVFQAIWLNVVLPGHTRGVVTLAGADCDACAARQTVLSTNNSHCCSTASSPTRHQPHDQPTPKQKASCALCAFAARVTPPPPITVAPAHTGSSIPLPLPRPDVPVSLELIPTYYGNGPPSIA